ncbi:PF09996 family protein [Bacteriovorax sp. BSW11_IV]|uniref:DUF2237 family protein n=1 Tax=Bacteriovorax sp. BSW11_IV TaxID=1353529 RepID=UPI00038A38F3|nr:DUF2237 domain-containing protein [Bacteriovorax sp. BSW11_IV]EQC50100.1 PF09996 family protein [Bacteriovorax sp. BSW11_IV]
MFESKNVLGTKLEVCSLNPRTGFFRDGCCNTGHDDTGMHTVCVEVTSEFLDYSMERGNDLSTPRPEFGFLGLIPGDRWCLCAARWLEAYKAGCAPKVKLTATHEETLAIIPYNILESFEVDED